MTSRRVYAFGASTLTILFGNIVDSPADVLVSSDDYLLSMGGGVSYAIAAAAGSGLTLDAAKSGPRVRGDVVVTTAGALNARYIFHVVTIGPLPTGVEAAPTAEELVRSATGRCLSLLEPLGVDSIAFPALGTGVAGYSMEGAAAAMADVIVDHLEKAKAALDISLYLYARPGVRELDFISFYEEFARRKPAIARHETVATPAPERPEQAVRSVSKLLELERERQRLEQEIVLLRNNPDGASDPAADRTLNRELQANQVKRLEVASQQKRTE